VPAFSVVTNGSWCGKSVISPSVPGTVSDAAGPSKRFSVTDATVTRRDGIWQISDGKWGCGVLCHFLFVICCLLFAICYLLYPSLHIERAFIAAIVFASEYLAEAADSVCE
jgi:hypothetical protein